MNITVRLDNDRYEGVHSSRYSLILLLYTTAEEGSGIEWDNIVKRIKWG